MRVSEKHKNKHKNTVRIYDYISSFFPNQLLQVQNFTQILHDNYLKQKIVQKIKFN